MPAFRINLSEELQKKGLLLGIEGIKAFYKGGSVEFPKERDYQPWKNFEHDWKKGEFHDKKLIYYHSFQLLQVQNILKNKKFSFIYYDSYADDSIQKIIVNIKKSKEWNARLFQNNALSNIKTIGLLMLLEEAYKYQAFGHFSIPLFRKSNGSVAWIKWRKEKYDPQKLLKDSGFTLDDVRKLYDRFATQGHWDDPIEKWYDLTRIMRPSVLEELKGKPLLAQLYYCTARMLALFLYDLNKEKVLEPDTIFDGTKGEWKKDIYSNPFDYTSRKTQRGIIRYFVRDVTTRLFLLVEGDTEEKIVKRIFEALDIEEGDSINLINCNGVSNMSPNKIKSIVQTANRDHASIFVIADNEQNTKNKIEEIKKLVSSDFGFHIWNESFESDNFGRQKLMNLVNSYLKKYDEKLSIRSVEQLQKNGLALVSAIEKAYQAKYHNGIYKKIPRKPELSLELMRNRFKKISRQKKTEGQFPIEKVLDTVFNMIPYWG